MLHFSPITKTVLRWAILISVPLIAIVQTDLVNKALMLLFILIWVVALIMIWLGRSPKRDGNL